MASTILCLLGLLAYSQAGVLKLDPRIVNGRDAKPGELPYQISLQDQTNFHFCGGSVMNEKYVITAAHCVKGKKPGDIKVIAGTINLEDPQATRQVENVIVHERYNAADSWVNDIALLKMKVPFKLSDSIKSITLPEKNHVVNPDDIADVSGWGRLWQSGPTTTKLQIAKIYIADQNYCQQVYNGLGYNVYATQVCAYDPTEEKGSCHGDSGGPLTVKGKLVGLVSWASGCASTFYPTVYTRVASYIDWINANSK